MTTKAVEIKSVETDLAFGEICSSAIEGFHELLAIVYKPLFESQDSWGKSSGEDVKEFFSSLSKFSHALLEAVGILQGGIELQSLSGSLILRTSLKLMIEQRPTMTFWTTLLWFSKIGATISNQFWVNKIDPKLTMKNQALILNLSIGEIEWRNLIA